MTKSLAFLALGILLFVLHPRSACAGATYSGKSEAKILTVPGKGGSSTMTAKNTEFLFESFLSGPGKNTMDTVMIYEIKKSLTMRTGEEIGNADFTINASDPVQHKKLWTIQERADGFTPIHDYFVVQTVAGGDCKNSYRLYSKQSGKLLLAYTFAQRHNSFMPVVLRKDAFTAEGFRFLAYQDNYWGCRDKKGLKDPEGKLALAGVISYANPNKAIQKVAIFYDEKALGDPSDDPNSITMKYKDTEAKFTGYSDDKGAVEFDYWWRKNDPSFIPEVLKNKIFSGIEAKIDFGVESITIPIQDDRLNVKEVKLGKIYKKLVELQENDF